MPVVGNIFCRAAPHYCVIPMPRLEIVIWYVESWYTSTVQSAGRSGSYST